MQGHYSIKSDNSSIGMDAVPIREISRLTGINTVTLRAWERRYGLLKPQRTQKGHRLYSKDDVARVKEIQVWLKRGLAISKVNAILSSQADEVSDISVDSIWLSLQQQLDKTIGHFNRRQLERSLEDLLALYPPEMLADELFLPLLAQLKDEDTSKPARLAFFNTVLAEYLYTVQYRQRQLAQGSRVLLISSAVNDSSPLALLLSYALLVNGQRVEFLNHLDVQESVLVADALNSELLVICGYEALNVNELQRYLKQWHERTFKPIILVGQVAHLYNALGEAQHSFVKACDTQQEAIACIKQFSMNGQHYE